MSKFFRGDSSDSESSESEEELLLSDEEAPRPTTTTAKPMARFLRTAGSDSSSSSSDEPSDEESDESDEEGSDEEDKPSRILSAADRRLKEMEGSGKAVDNALKINDWQAISTGAYLPAIISSVF